MTLSDRQPQFGDDDLVPAPIIPVSEEDLIDQGIDPKFILPVEDDPTTDIIEQDSNVGSALQQAYIQQEKMKKNTCQIEKLLILSCYQKMQKKN